MAKSEKTGQTANFAVCQNTKTSPFGIDVKIEKEWCSLTDIWKASGLDKDMQPYRWLMGTTAKNFIDVAEKFTGSKVLKISKGGKNPGTWAHKQVALEYARYLDPQLAIYVNELFLKPEKAVEHGQKVWKLQGKSDNWIDKRQSGMLVRKHFTSVLSRHGVNGPDGYREATNAIYTPLFGGGSDFIRYKKRMPDGANCREGMTAIELAAVELAELMSIENIEKLKVTGNDDCAEVCRHTSQSIARGIVGGLVK